MRASRIRNLACGLAVVSLVGCASSPPKQTGLMEDLEINANRRELQILMYAYGGYFAGQVELAADRIYNETTDPTVRERAVEWKVNAVPGMVRSCFANDPSAGMIGAWIFALQLQEYFETGNGKDVFGAQQHIAVETSRQLTEELQGIIRMTWNPSMYEKGVTKLGAVAAEHPIKNQLFVRETLTPKLAAEMSGDVTGGLGAAGAMYEQMLALTDRANVMTALLPRQVQWQSQLLLAQGEAIVASRIDSAFSDLQPFLEYLSDERRQVTKDISSERSAILSGIAVERLAVLEALAQERSAVLTALGEERNVTLQEINALTLAAIKEIVIESQAVADHAIDRVYRRSLQLLAIPALVCLVLVIIVIVLVRNAINKMPDYRGSSTLR